MLYISADNHLSRFIWKRRRELEGDSYRAFVAMVDAIIADPIEESKALLLAGDITDRSEIDSATFRVLDESAERLTEAGIPVFYVIGNHDLDEPDWPSAVGFVSLAGKTVRVDDRRLQGLGYLPREALHSALGHLLPCDILVLHQSFEHLLPFEGSYDLCLDDLPLGIRNVVVGDVHTPNITPLHGKGWCLSPGSTTPRRITEAHIPGYWKLAKGAAEPVFCPLAHRLIIRTEVKTAEELQRLAGAFTGADKGTLAPLVELAYPLELAVAVEQFMVDHGGQAAFFPRPGTTGKMLADEAARPVFDRLTLESALPLLGLADKDPRTHTFLHDLLTNTNVNDYLEQLIAAAKKGD